MFETEEGTNAVAARSIDASGITSSSKLIIINDDDEFRGLLENLRPEMKGVLPNASPSPPLHFVDSTAIEVKAAAQFVRDNIIMLPGDTFSLFLI